MVLDIEHRHQVMMRLGRVLSQAIEGQTDAAYVIGLQA